MDPSKIFFPETYEVSRAWFRRQIESIRGSYPEASCYSEGLFANPELTVDWIYAPSGADQCLIISTGLHGIEGFTGAAVCDVFIQRFLPDLDPTQLDILLIHAINPWGMHHRRRVNAENVDLNRNFRFDGAVEATMDNPGYRAMRGFLHPTRRLRAYPMESFRFLVTAISMMNKFGVSKIKEATLLGQDDDPLGIYFGGYEQQQEARLAMDLVTKVIKEKKRTIHLDVHTGYGASSSMTVVNSPGESEPPERWRERFRFPHVIRADSQAFYEIQGDWLDALYRFARQFAQGHDYYGTAFEFGTIGDGMLQQMRSLKAVIFENQVVHHGVTARATLAYVRKEYRKLFDPTHRWYRQAVVGSSEKAFEGILSWFGLLSSPIRTPKR